MRLVMKIFLTCLVSMILSIVWMRVDETSPKYRSAIQVILFLVSIVGMGVSFLAGVWQS
jgi:hypothetical protein